jgi:hypothetical protein
MILIMMFNFFLLLANNFCYFSKKMTMLWTYMGGWFYWHMSVWKRSRSIHFVLQRTTISWKAPLKVRLTLIVMILTSISLMKSKPVYLIFYKPLTKKNHWKSDRNVILMTISLVKSKHEIDCWDLIL